MKKLIMIFALSTLILTFSSGTQAGITYMDVVDASDAQPDTWFLPEGEDPLGDDYYRWHDEDWAERAATRPQSDRVQHSFDARFRIADVVHLSEKAQILFRSQVVIDQR